MSENFLFITSRGRSGSTLFWLLLDAHPNIQIPPEGHFIKYLYSTYGRKKRWTVKDKENFVRDLQFDYKIQYWKLDYDQILNELLTLPEDMTFRQACDIVYFNYSSPAIKENILVFGDKTPNNTMYLDVLIKLYPKATFVHLVRDYRDVIEAFLRVNFESHIVSSLAFRWNMYNEPFLRYHEKYPNQFHIIKYEDLVNNTEATLTQVLSKLKLSFTPEMFKFRDSFRQIRKDFKYGEDSFFKSIDEPISTSKVGLWRKKLTKKQIVTAEHICGQLGEKLGYQTEFTKYSRLPRLRYLGGFFVAYAYPSLDYILFYFPIWVKKSFYLVYNNFIGNLLQVKSKGGRIYTSQKV